MNIIVSLSIIHSAGLLASQGLLGPLASVLFLLWLVLPALTAKRATKESS
jgi:hypothetical protein